MADAMDMPTSAPIIPDDDEDFEEAVGGGTGELNEERDLTGDKGVLKTILKHGDGWETPSKGDEVHVHYVGTLLDGTKFDSSRDRGDPFTFKLGEGNVIKGWDKGVATMKKGEKSVLVCAPDYAYGAAGSPPTIPPNATLSFEVELLSWKSIKDIGGDGGVIKTVEKEGTGWSKPGDADEALVKYEVRLAGGKEAVAASPEGGAIVAVGSGAPLRGFGTALKTMKEGERASLKLKPEYGFAPGAAPGGVPADAELEADLELVVIRKVEDVTGDGGVVTKIIKKGQDYKRPNEGARVRLAYTARIGDAAGPVFEQRSREDPLEFAADEDQVVEGLDLAVMKLNEGEVAEVSIAPQYGFGDAEAVRAQGSVPPGSRLHYTVEIVGLTKAKESWDMSVEEKLGAARRRKELGNALFKAGKWRRALKKYKDAAQAVDYDKDYSTEEKKESSALKKSAHLNSAAAHIKLGEFKDTITAANKVLAADPGCVKGLYRRAQAHLGQQDFVEAELDIRAALQFEPGNKEVRALLARYKKESAAANARDAKMFKTMFAKLAKLPDTDPPPKPAAAADVSDEHNEAVMADAEAADEHKVEASTGHNGLQDVVLEQNGHAEPPAAAPAPMAVDS